MPQGEQIDFHAAPHASGGPWMLHLPRPDLYFMWGIEPPLPRLNAASPHDH